MRYPTIQELAESLLESNLYHPGIKIPRPTSKYAYKAMYVAPNDNPWTITSIPGYVYTYEPDQGQIMSRTTYADRLQNTLVYRMEIPEGMLDYFPENEYFGNGMDYNRNTQTKPGWLANDYIAIITQPTEMHAHQIQPGNIDLTNVHTLIGLAEKTSGGDEDIWLPLISDPITDSIKAIYYYLGMEAVYENNRLIGVEGLNREWTIHIHKRGI